MIDKHRYGYRNRFIGWRDGYAKNSRESKMLDDMAMEAIAKFHNPDNPVIS
jgi:hypothetical protein